MAQPPSFDWNHARAFWISAELGSFSAAARRLGTSQPTISRQIAALEEELGLSLFARTGRQLQLTAAGQRLREHVESMGEAANGFALAASGQASTLQGKVTISASELIAAYLLPPALGLLRKQHPGIQIKVVASNLISDLRRREADIAIRNVQPQQADLWAKKIATREAHFYAHRSYLDEIGNPQTTEELVARGCFFGFADLDLMLQHMRAMGLNVSAENFPFTVENHLVQWQMALHGLGICPVMSEVAALSPTMVRVLPEQVAALPVPLWLTAHEELRSNLRIRTVFDTLAEVLAVPLGDSASAP